VDRLGDQLSMSASTTAQFIGNDLAGFGSMTSQ
jgi:hypothetical protein